mgnify:FL=1
MKTLFRILGTAAAVAVTGAAIVALDKILNQKDPLHVEEVEFPEDAEQNAEEAAKTSEAYAEAETKASDAANEKAAEEAAPEELMPSVCWSQLEKLLPRMALPEALQLESASEAAAAPVRRRTVRRVIFIGKTSCKKRIGAARQNAKAGKKFAGAARRGAHCRAVKRSALQTDLI